MPIAFVVIKSVVYTILWFLLILAVAQGTKMKSIVGLFILVVLWALVNTLAMEILSTTDLWQNAIVSVIVAFIGFGFGIIYLNKPE